MKKDRDEGSDYDGEGGASTVEAASTVEGAATVDGDGGASNYSGQTSVRGFVLKRSFTSKQLEQALRPQYEAMGRRWKLQDVKDAVVQIDPGARHICGHILQRLRGAHHIDSKTSTKLIQGLALCLKRRGFGVVLHTADANSVREQALELARKRYYGEAKKRNISKAARFTRDSVAATLEAIAEEVPNMNGEMEPAEYLTGWTCVPPSQMDGGYAFYAPVDAIDCAAMRGRATGVAVVRAKKDANRRIHAVSVSHMLAAESDLSVGAHMAAEKSVLPSEAFNTDDYLTIEDGGKSLHSQTRKYHPKASTMRCSRHMEADLAIGTTAAKESVPIFKKLVQVPKGHAKAADALYKDLPAESPLRKIPKEELCPVYLKKVHFPQLPTTSLIKCYVLKFEVTPM